ncbi:MAG: hypothetical protein C5B53_08755 [Candidatus Melainabacteria bacterium]|nr:MAG: hypothetical protein C5B53_08755 [Candidatus Melainabacteria bacterium]
MFFKNACPSLSGCSAPTQAPTKLSKLKSLRAVSPLLLDILVACLNLSRPSAFIGRNIAS